VVVVDGEVVDGDVVVMRRGFRFLPVAEAAARTAADVVVGAMGCRDSACLLLGRSLRTLAAAPPPAARTATTTSAMPTVQIRGCRRALALRVIAPPLA